MQSSVRVDPVLGLEVYTVAYPEKRPSRIKANVEPTRRSSRLAAKAPPKTEGLKSCVHHIDITAADKTQKTKPIAAKETKQMAAAAPAPITIVEAKGQQLTLAELLAALSDHLEKNPEAGATPVFHVEFGGITRSSMLTFDNGKVVME
jgi:hypothetical protein